MKFVFGIQRLAKHQTHSWVNKAIGITDSPVRQIGPVDALLISGSPQAVLRRRFRASALLHVISSLKSHYVQHS